MDDLARNHYRLCFENKCLKVTGTEFQNMFCDLMERAHPGDFVKTKPWGRQGDQKNDGYLPSRRMLFAVYAPERMESADAVKKISDDFNGALPHWRQYFDIWTLVHNCTRGFPPDVTKTLESFRRDHAPLAIENWGPPALEHVVLGLNADDLVALLGPAPTREGMIKVGMPQVQPILGQISRLPSPPLHDLRPVPANKLTVNSLSTHVATLLRAGMAREDLVRRYFAQTAEPRLRDEIASAFREQYRQLVAGGLAPDVIFSRLQGFVGGSSVGEPYHQEAVLAVLAYMFQECEIFERPQDETA